MCEDRREIHVYSTTTGKEIFTTSCGDSFAGYRFEKKVVEGRTEWRIIEVTLKHLTTNYNVICIFCKKTAKFTDLQTREQFILKLKFKF